MNINYRLLTLNNLRIFIFIATVILTFTYFISFPKLIIIDFDASSIHYFSTYNVVIFNFNCVFVLCWLSPTPVDASLLPDYYRFFQAKDYICLGQVIFIMVIFISSHWWNHWKIEKKKLIIVINSCKSTCICKLYLPGVVHFLNAFLLLFLMLLLFSNIIFNMHTNSGSWYFGNELFANRHVHIEIIHIIIENMLRKMNYVPKNNKGNAPLRYTEKHRVG